MAKTASLRKPQAVPWRKRRPAVRRLPEPPAGPCPRTPSPLQEFAEKFSTEQDLPYLRFVRGEGLDIIGAHYVPNLRTVELKPWPRRGGRGVFINHEASRFSNDCYVCEIAPGRSLRRASPLRGDDAGAHRPRLDHGVEQCRPAHHLRMAGRRDLRHPAQLLLPAFQRLRPRVGPLRRRHQRAIGDQPLR